MSLTSTEGECVAASETAAETVFIKNSLEFLEIEMTPKMKLFADNVGAI